MWKIITFALFCISTLGISKLSFAEGEVKAPILYRPIFETSKGSANAGTAFIIKYKTKYYAVSAQHLIGTAGGLERDFNGTELVSIFKSVTLKPIFSGYKTIISKALVNIPQAEAISDATARHDIFIAPLGDSIDYRIDPGIDSQIDSKIDSSIDSTPLTLSTKNPKAGDKIYLYSAVANSKSLLHKATVSQKTKNMLVYIFDNKSINLRATSGAPVLNQNFQVIGINLAGGNTNDGAVIGFANPAQSIADHLPK